jgi:ankyrin repeat protein
MNSTPLMKACENGSQEIVEILLENKADLKAVDSNGLSALMTACVYGKLDIVKLLLNHQVDINLKDKNGHTAFTLSCENSQLEIAELLASKGADLNTRDHMNWTALSKACLNNHKQVAETLIRMGANIHHRDKEGWTPLSTCSWNGNFDLVKLLIRKCADVNNQDNSGMTPLLLACENRHENVARLLIEEGADLNILNKNGHSAYSICIDSQDELKRLGEFIRNRLIRNLFEFFQHKSSEELQNLVVDAIDQDTLVILHRDYLKAFETMDVENLAYDFELVRNRRIAEYFLSFEFQEKYIEDMMNILKSQIELLEIAKIKLQLNFAELKAEKQERDDEVHVLAINLTHKRLKELISNYELIMLIENETTYEAKVNRASLFLYQTQAFERKIKEMIHSADELFKLIQNKCSKIPSVRFI